MAQYSQKCVDIIKKWEGCYLNAYKCPAGVWTIGWGSIINLDTKQPIKEGDVISQQTADMWLIEEITEKAEGITKIVKVEINQSQFDALVSFAYNVGTGALAQSTLLKKLNAKDFDGAAQEFHRWNKGDGVVLQGLVARRREEAELFLSEESKKNDDNVDLVVDWLEIHRIDQNGVIISGVVAYHGSEPKALWSGTDKTAMIEFMQRFIHAKSVLVAQNSKPWPGKIAPKEPPYLKCSRGMVAKNGLEELKLEIVGTPEWWVVNSGVAGKQVFLKGGTGELPGTLYPAPQGEYSVEDIQWSDGKDNYDASHGEGLGPVFVPFEPKFQTKRGSFGFHLDANRNTAPGSAGCIVFSHMADLKSFVAALRKYDPKKLLIDWKLS